MGNIGPFEIIVLLAIVAAIGGVILLALRAGGRPTADLAWRTPGFLPPLSDHLQERVRELGVGRKVEAIRLIRQETGLGLKEAKTVADAIFANRFVPTPPERPGTGDLASRVQQLKAAGRAEQAIYLVRGETGMSQEQAEAFVNLL